MYNLIWFDIYIYYVVLIYIWLIYNCMTVSYWLIVCAVMVPCVFITVYFILIYFIYFESCFHIDFDNISVIYYYMFLNCLLLECYMCLRHVLYNSITPTDSTHCYTCTYFSVILITMSCFIFVLSCSTIYISFSNYSVWFMIVFPSLLRFLPSCKSWWVDIPLYWIRTHQNLHGWTTTEWGYCF